MNELKVTVLELVKNDNFSLETLKIALDPISNFIDNPVFVNQLKQIVKIVVEDRDGNNKFTVNDLTLLSKDITAISSLISSLFLAIGTIQHTKLKYEHKYTEQVVFNLLAYIFLVVVPKETGNPLSLQQKEDVLTLVMNIYQLIMSAQVTKELIEKIANWFKKKGWCKCICNVESKQAVYDKHMPYLKAEFGASIQKNKEINQLRDEIDNLHHKLKSLENIPVVMAGSVSYYEPVHVDELSLIIEPDVESKVE
jgi:hypothetical protein